MLLLRLSKWTYDTGATSGISVAFVVASGGTIVLRDPAKGEQDFYDGGLGVGAGWGIKIPNIKLR